MSERSQHRIAEIGYAAEHTEITYDGHNGPEINLGLGIPLVGPHPELAQLLSQRDSLTALRNYPEPEQGKTRELLISSIGLIGATKENVLFKGGSYEVGDEVLRYLAQKGYRRIYVPPYSFPNVAQWAIRAGTESTEYVRLPHSSLDPLLGIAQVLEMGNDSLENTIVYLDCPNNPTGSADPELTRRIIAHAHNNGAIAIIDMAFGEVLGDDYRNLTQYAFDHGAITLGSASKTQGLPGARAGWGILPPELSQNGYSGPHRLVFSLNAEAEYACNHLFAPETDGNTLARRQAVRVAEYNTATNIELIAGLQRLGLVVLPTDLRTAIQVAVCPEHPDFYQRLRTEGILTESLADYQETLGEVVGYGHSAVRILTPGPGDLQEVLRRVELAIVQ